MLKCKKKKNTILSCMATTCNKLNTQIVEGRGVLSTQHYTDTKNIFLYCIEFV